jgi:hypothetical protein
MPAGGSRIEEASASESRDDAALAHVGGSEEATSAAMGKDKIYAQMDELEQECILELGWTAEGWDAGDEEPFEKPWSSLSENEQDAAKTLGLDHRDFAARETADTVQRLNSGNEDTGIEHEVPDSHRMKVEGPENNPMPNIVAEEGVPPVLAPAGGEQPESSGGSVAVADGDGWDDWEEVGSASSDVPTGDEKPLSPRMATLPTLLESDERSSEEEPTADPGAGAANKMMPATTEEDSPGLAEAQTDGSILRGDYDAAEAAAERAEALLATQQGQGVVGSLVGHPMAPAAEGKATAKATATADAEEVDSLERLLAGYRKPGRAAELARTSRQKRGALSVTAVEKLQRWPAMEAAAAQKVVDVQELGRAYVAATASQPPMEALPGGATADGGGGGGGDDLSSSTPTVLQQLEEDARAHMQEVRAQHQAAAQAVARAEAEAQGLVQEAHDRAARVLAGAEEAAGRRSAAKGLALQKVTEALAEAERVSKEVKKTEQRARLVMFDARNQANDNMQQAGRQLAEAQQEADAVKAAAAAAAASERSTAQQEVMAVHEEAVAMLAARTEVAQAEAAAHSARLRAEREAHEQELEAASQAEAAARSAQLRAEREAHEQELEAASQAEAAARLAQLRAEREAHEQELEAASQAEAAAHSARLRAEREAHEQELEARKRVAEQEAAIARAHAAVAAQELQAERRRHAEQVSRLGVACMG